jgi:hypothetical protein
VTRCASPSSTRSMPRKRTDTLHAGFRARLRDLSVPGPLVKYSASSTHTAPTPAECGRPLGRTVATKNVMSASGVSLARMSRGRPTAAPRTRIGRDCASRSARSWCQSYPCVERARKSTPNRRKSSVSASAAPSHSPQRWPHRRCRIRRALPRPRPDHLRHCRRDRDDPGARTAAAERRALARLPTTPGSHRNTCKPQTLLSAPRWSRDRHEEVPDHGKQPPLGRGHVCLTSEDHRPDHRRVVVRPRLCLQGLSDHWSHGLQFLRSQTAGTSGPTYPPALPKLPVQHTPCTVGSSSGRPDRAAACTPFWWV